MTKIYHALILFVLPFTAVAQPYGVDVGGSIGASNYLGEMGGEANTRKDFIADLKFEETRMAAGVFVRKRVLPQVSIKTALNYCRIAGADALSTNPGRNARNLSFRNDIYELSCEGQYFFYDINDLGRTYRYRDNFRAYAFLGVAGFFSNPKAKLDGDWYALQPLETEGVHYNRMGIAIPSGMGFYFTINKRYRIGWELGWRKTFTDYLDDVSTVYADPSEINSAEGIALANRTDPSLYTAQADYPHPNNYTPGSKRGDPSHKDAYFFSTLNMSYVFRDVRWGKGPIHIWVKGNYKVRTKLRAKF